MHLRTVRLQQKIRDMTHHSQRHRLPRLIVGALIFISAVAVAQTAGQLSPLNEVLRPLLPQGLEVTKSGNLNVQKTSEWRGSTRNHSVTKQTIEVYTNQLDHRVQTKLLTMREGDVVQVRRATKDGVPTHIAIRATSVKDERTSLIATKLMGESLVSASFCHSPNAEALKQLRKSGQKVDQGTKCISINKESCDRILEQSKVTSFRELEKKLKQNPLASGLITDVNLNMSSDLNRHLLNENFSGVDFAIGSAKPVMFVSPAQKAKSLTELHSDLGVPLEFVQSWVLESCRVIHSTITTSPTSGPVPHTREKSSRTR